MRKILIMFLITILLGGLFIITTQGMVLGGIVIPSIRTVMLNNQSLETNINNLQARINGEYKTAQLAVKTKETDLQKAKQSYQDKITYSTEEELQNANNIDKYEIGYLWTKLGVYARKNNLELQADLKDTGVTFENKDDASDSAKMCDLNITITGEYLNVSEFVYAIENDNNLGFRIRNFSLVPYSETELQGRFTITNVGINSKTLNSSSNLADATSSTSENTDDTTSSDDAETNNNNNA